MFIFDSIAESTSKHWTAHIDDRLLLGISRGDQSAFSTLYDLAGRSVYAYALSILKNPQDAEDVLQDTFLKIRSAAGLYSPKGKPMAWIMTIVRNLCFMKLREQKHLAIYELDDAQIGADLSQIEDLEDRLVMRAALKILTEEECQIIVLHAVTGWKHREIADLMDLPISTVLSKYRRGLRKLKSELEGKI